MQPARPGAASAAAARARAENADWVNARSLPESASYSTSLDAANSRRGQRFSCFRGDFAALRGPGEQQPDDPNDDPHVGKVEHVPLEPAEMEQEEVGDGAIDEPVDNVRQRAANDQAERQRRKQAPRAPQPPAEQHGADDAEADEQPAAEVALLDQKAV